MLVRLGNYSASGTLVVVTALAVPYAGIEQSYAAHAILQGESTPSLEALVAAMILVCRTAPEMKHELRDRRTTTVPKRHQHHQVE